MNNPRSIIIDRPQANRTLLEVLQTAFRLSRGAALRALSEKQVCICGGVCIDPQRRTKIGQHIQLFARLPSKGARPHAKEQNTDKGTALATEIRIRYCDDQILVVEKPPGLTTVRHADEVETQGKRGKKYLPPTLVDLLPAVLARVKKSPKGRIRAVHRLDKETSGLVVLACTSEAESNLGKQFRAHTTGRKYLALVRGQAKDARIESTFVPDRGDGRRGSLGTPRPTGGEGPGVRGQHAVTHVRVVKKLGDFTLVECELETGRTHQVRIHLGEAGTPLCGERIYDRPVHGKPLPDGSGAERPMLHAAYLAVDHPTTGKRMEWHAETPADMRKVIGDLEAPG